jgi:hypothetical protein
MIGVLDVEAMGKQAQEILSIGAVASISNWTVKPAVHLNLQGVEHCSFT